MISKVLREDLRSRVLKASSEGVSARQAAGRFGVRISTAIRGIGRVRFGERMARPKGWRRGSSLDPHEAFIVAMIEGQKNVTLDEMVTRLAAQVDLSIGAVSIPCVRPACRLCQAERNASNRAGPAVADVIHFAYGRPLRHASRRSRYAEGDADRRAAAGRAAQVDHQGVAAPPLRPTCRAAARGPASARTRRRRTRRCRRTDRRRDSVSVTEGGTHRPPSCEPRLTAGPSASD
jgi:transposase